MSFRLSTTLADKIIIQTLVCESPSGFDSKERVHLTGRQISEYLEDANHFGAEGDSASIGVGEVDCSVEVRVHEIIIQTLVSLPRVLPDHRDFRIVQQYLQTVAFCE